MELDDAYDNLGHIPGAMDFPPRWEKAAQGFRDALVKAGRARLDMSYGPTARQSYDLFFPEGQPEGLCVFVHGGYWRRFHGSVFSHLATGMLARDWAVAMASYDLCPDVRIREITRQIASMVPHVAKEVAGPIWGGADERPAFLDQARWLSEAWDCPRRIAPSKHHLDVIDALTDPRHAIVADILG